MNIYDKLLGISFAALILGTLLFFSILEARSLYFVHYSVKIKSLPSVWWGFKIIHLSDLHIVNNTSVLTKIKYLIRLFPDSLVVITGDVISNKIGIKKAFYFLATLASSKSPLLVVWGNNDKALAKYVKTKKISGLYVLENDGFVFYKNGTSLNIIGVDDPSKKKDDLPFATQGLDKNGINILLAHSPEIFPKALCYNFDLILAGHTHGGQIVFPWIGAIYNHTGFPFTYGHFRKGNTQMIVSRGIGTSFVPLRFLAPPEIGIITLLPERH